MYTCVCDIFNNILLILTDKLLLTLKIDLFWYFVDFLVILNLILNSFYLKDLKTICWGSPKIIPGQAWIHGISFNVPEEPNGFGIKVPGGGTKGFLMVLQGLVLKHLLFAEKPSRKKSV